MDRLIRKVNRDNPIQGLNIGIQVLMDKIYGYADDIVFLQKTAMNKLKTNPKHITSSVKYQGLRLVM